MKLRRFDPVLRQKALEMYWGGLESSIIAKHFGVNHTTEYTKCRACEHGCGINRARETFRRIVQAIAAQAVWSVKRKACGGAWAA
jgi:uncharacterized Fe-S radical SAM superfamily protein PflX